MFVKSQPPKHGASIARLGATSEYHSPSHANLQTINLCIFLGEQTDYSMQLQL